MFSKKNALITKELKMFPLVVAIKDILMFKVEIKSML